MGKKIKFTQINKRSEIEKSDNKAHNILFRNINEFNVKLILIIGVIFIMLSGYTSYALFSDTIISNNIINLKIGKKNYEKSFSYTGACEEYTVPYNGYYKIEAWGAQGGGTGEYEGGKGAYTSGIIRLLKGETLSICVGETGNTTDGNHTIFNNGSSTLLYTYNTSSGYLYGGGGATDIRLVNGTWNNNTSLNSRIMVAAGGGGGSAYFSINKGGAGGGLIGLNGTIGGSNGVAATGATQITSGTNGNSTITNTFGVNTDISTSGQIVTKGGTGYYTGGNGAHANNTVGSGAGGSSFISGYAGVNAITSSIDRTHTNDTLHYSSKYFINGKMQAGVNSGNGKAKIAYVSSTKPERINASLNNVRYIKECLNGSDVSSYNHLGELEAIYNGVNVAKGLIVKLYNQDGTEVSGYNSDSFSRMTDGDITTNDNYGATYSGNQCYVLDLGQTYDLDEIAVWHKWNDGRTYNDNYTYVSSDNSNWTLVIDKQEPETSEGKRVSAYEIPNLVHRFSYTGACEEYDVPYTGYYKIEAWGAQGGGTGEYEGGKGGYTSGITKLLKGETLSICVGETGNTTNESRVIFNNGSSTKYEEYYSSKGYLYAGGGATDIRLVNGAWNNDNSLNSRIMVAAGGGGGSSYTKINKGGAGGGLIGLNGTIVGVNGVIATGATQASSGTNGDSTITNKFGVNTSPAGRAKGGTGYYTGGNGAHGDSTIGSGAGGSSFISGYAGVNAITSSTDRTHTNNTLHYSNKYFIDGKMQAGTNTGNGKAKITYVSSTKPERINASLDNVRYIKDCVNGNEYDNINRWNEIQAIYNGTNILKGKTVNTIDNGTLTSSVYITDGDIGKIGDTDGYSTSSCIIIDIGETYDLDEIAVWHYWGGTAKNTKDHYTYVSSDNTNWVKVIDKQEAETSEGKRVSAYEGASLIIEQSKGGTITCTNNTTNQTSTTSLTVSEGDSITCKVNLSTNYELTSLKLEDTSITNNTAFTYTNKGNTRVKATYYCNDSSGPTITLTNDSNGNWTFGPVKMTITATDPSGVKSIYYRYNSDSTSTIRNDWSSTSSITNGIQVKGTWSAARDNYVYIVATDNLGNTSTSTTRVRIKSCGCGYRSSTYASISWYHAACNTTHSTAYLHLCKCSDGSIYNCRSSGWSAAGGSGCYVHTGYNTYSPLDYSWSNYW